MAIPLPGQPGEALLSGLNVGSGMMDRIIGRQQGQQNINLNKMQQERLQQLLPYQIAQYEQQAAMAPLEQALRQAQTQQALAQVAQLQQDQQLMASLLGGGQMPSMGLAGGDLMSPSGNIPMGMSGQLSSGSAQQGGIDFSSLAQNPVIAEFIKKKTGIDLYAESPQMKSTREFQDFQRKEQYKQKTPLDIPSTSTINNLQRVVFSSDSLIPDLELLAKIPAPGYKGFLSPNDYAKYQDVITSALDNMLGAYGLTSTDANVKSMRHKLERGFGESDKHYQDRIKATIADVKARQKAASDMLKKKEVSISPRSHETTGAETGLKLTDEDL